MKRLLVLLSAISIFTVNSSSQSWVWAQQAVCFSGNPQEGLCTASDSKGSVLIGGQYSDGISYGSYGVYSNGCYVFKFDSTGNPLWGHGSWGTAWAYGVAADKWDNVFLTGDFSSSTEFLSYTLNSKGADMFLVKYDANGAIKWAVQSNVHNAGYYVLPYAVTTDSYGNAYIAGVFNDTTIFGQDTLKTNITNGFVAKYDSAGNEIWARMTTTTGGIYTQSIAVYQDFLYITGYFVGNLKMGIVSLTGNAKTETYLIKCDTAGDAIWGRQVANLGAASSLGYAVVTDKAGFPYIAGVYKGDVKFGNATKNSATNAPYLVKYDPAGNVRWIQTGTVLDASDWQGSCSMAVDTLNRLYLSDISNTNGGVRAIQFSVDTFTSNGSEPFTIMEFDTAGNLICGSITESGGPVTIAAAPAGRNVFASGSFFSTDPFGSTVLNSAPCSTNTSFVAMWRPGSAVVNSGMNDLSSNITGVSVFPNPGKDQFTIEIKNQKLKVKNIEVYTILGEKVYSQLSTFNSPLSINLSSQPNGVYFYKLESEDGSLIGIGKLVLQK
jgi:Secretion system C-terminal sorting domain